MAKRYTEYSIEGQLTITDGLSPYTFPASAGVAGEVLTMGPAAGEVSWQASVGSDTNIANANLTLNANRTTDLDGYLLGFIDSSGGVNTPKVGIGTAAPTATLELSTDGSNQVTFELSDNGTEQWHIETDFATANKQVNFKGGTYNFMTFEVAGTGSDRIGMGTTTPNSNVHISGNGTISSYADETSLEITNTTGAAPGNINNVAALRFSQAGTSIPSGLIVSGREGDYTAGNEDGYLAFSVSKSTVLTEWLHIDSDGDTTFSTWKIVGNDLMPMNEPANIGSPGSPANRVDTIYMDSTIDYITDLKFEENGTDRIILNSGGDIELGIDGGFPTIKVVSTDGEIAVGNISALTDPLATVHIFSQGSGSGKSLYIENNIGADVLSIEDGGDIIFGNLADSYTFPTARAGAGEVLTDVLGNGVLSWQTAGGGAGNLQTVLTAGSTGTVTGTISMESTLGNVEIRQTGGGGGISLYGELVDITASAGDASIDASGDINIGVNAGTNINIDANNDIILDAAGGNIELTSYSSYISLWSSSGQIALTADTDIAFDIGSAGAPSIGDVLSAKDTFGNLEWVAPGGSNEICGYPIDCTSPGPQDGDSLVFNGSPGTWEPAPSVPKKTWAWGASRNSDKTSSIALMTFDSLPTNKTSYIAPFDCIITDISCATSVVPAVPWDAEVRVNGSMVASITGIVTDTAISNGLSVAVSAGDKVSFYCDTGGGIISCPLIEAWFMET